MIHETVDLSHFVCIPSGWIFINCHVYHFWGWAQPFYFCYACALFWNCFERPPHLLLGIESDFANVKVASRANGLLSAWDRCVTHRLRFEGLKFAQSTCMQMSRPQMTTYSHAHHPRSQSHLLTNSYPPLCRMPSQHISHKNIWSFTDILSAPMRPLEWSACGCFRNTFIYSQ